MTTQDGKGIAASPEGLRKVAGEVKDHISKFDRINDEFGPRSRSEQDIGVVYQAHNEFAKAVNFNAHRSIKQKLEEIATKLEETATEIVIAEEKAKSQLGKKDSIFPFQRGPVATQLDDLTTFTDDRLGR